MAQLDRVRPLRNDSERAKLRYTGTRVTVRGPVKRQHPVNLKILLGKPSMIPARLDAMFLQAMTQTERRILPMQASQCSHLRFPIHEPSRKRTKAPASATDLIGL